MIQLGSSIPSSSSSVVDRRQFLATTLALASSTVWVEPSVAQQSSGKVRTVLGPVDPQAIGATLMHEHAPLVDWSELYEVPIGPYAEKRDEMLTATTKLLAAFRDVAAKKKYPGQVALVECTPIRVGRYPELMVELAKQAQVHLIACTGFWCEAMAPQHPWALELGRQKDGVQRLADLFIREITEGMEDPHGKWGERFTTVKAGIIKCATSTWLRPSERRNHEAAAIASRETGCPITTHTTDGGGLEQAELFLKHKVRPEKIIIGHQGNKDDRTEDEEIEYHRRIAQSGCYVQFDRVGSGTKYGHEKLARQIRALVEAGFGKQVLLAHDHVPYFFGDYAAEKKKASSWKFEESDFTIALTSLPEALKAVGVSDQQIEMMLIHNPRRVLAF